MNRTLPNTRFPDYDLTKSNDLQAINKAVLEQMELTNPEIQKKLIGRLGIRNAQQMAVFLKSPEGKAEMAQVAKELAVLEKIQQNNSQQQMDNARRRKMILAFLLLGALSRSEAKSKRLNAIILQQYQKLLKLRNKDNGQSLDLMQVTSEVAHSYMNGLEVIILEQEALNQEIAAIAAAEQSLEKRYTLYEESLADIDALFGADIDSLKKEELERQISKLSGEIDEQTQEITRFLENNEDEKARDLLNEQNAKNLKIAGLKDLLAVKLGEKLLLTEEGSRANKYKDSAYIAQSRKTLIKIGDDLLLINAGEEEEVKNNQELRMQAKNDFLNRKAEMTPLRQLIKNNEKTERDILNFRTERVTQRQEELNQDAAELFNLLNNIQSAQATMSLTPGAPAPEISAPNSRLNSKLQSTTAHYAVARLETLQYHPAGNAGGPFDLRDALKNLGNNPALASMPLVREELNDIDPGQPIPKELYALILQRNNLTTGNPWSNNVNAPDYLQGPADQVYNKQAQNQVQEKPTAPTPLRTTPGPRGANS